MKTCGLIEIEHDDGQRIRYKMTSDAPPPPFTGRKKKGCGKPYVALAKALPHGSAIHELDHFEMVNLCGAIRRIGFHPLTRSLPSGYAVWKIVQPEP